MKLSFLRGRALSAALILSIVGAAGCAPSAVSTTTASARAEAGESLAESSAAASQSKAGSTEAIASSKDQSSPEQSVMDFSQKLELRKPREPIPQDPNILFLGNSFTYVNDLPGTFKALAESGGFTPGIVELSDGGYHLSYFADKEDELGSQFYQIAGEYPLDYVILQEQSRLPTMKREAKREMFPAARTLDERIKKAGGQTVFMMTWAYRDGDDLREYGINTVTSRDEMQTQLAESYMEIADELDALLSPAGIAFVRCADANPDIDLWDQEDNMHPTPAGTYLAACTLYATVFNQSPVGLAYTSDLDPETAAVLQQTAAELVLN